MKLNIAIGCPVRNRNWIFPDYLKHLRNLELPPGAHIHWVFLLNGDPEDRAEARSLIHEILGGVESENESIVIGEADFPEQSAEAQEYTRLAYLRNELREIVLGLRISHFFSIDSDILVPPEALVALLARNVPMVAALINNHPKPNQWYPNAGYVKEVFAQTSEGQPIAFESYVAACDLQPHTGIHRVQVTGAVALIRVDALIASEFAPHHTGEDYGFCWGLEVLGIDVWIDTEVLPEHRMISPQGVHQR